MTSLKCGGDSGCRYNFLGPLNHNLKTPRSFRNSQEAPNIESSLNLEPPGNFFSAAPGIYKLYSVQKHPRVLSLNYFFVCLHFCLHFLFVYMSSSFAIWLLTNLPFLTWKQNLFINSSWNLKNQNKNHHHTSDILVVSK